MFAVELGREVMALPMNARDRAVWEDAEGSLSVPKDLEDWSPPRLQTSQMERGILADYREGALQDGVGCFLRVNNVRKTAKTPRPYTFYQTYIGGLANIALELRLTAPYRRSVKMASQILKFKAYLALQRKETQRSVLIARELSVYF